MTPTDSQGIVIVDYGLGNLASVRNMIRKVGYDAETSSDPATIRRAARLLLPGVGAFDHGMRNLAERGLIEALNEAVLVSRVPILGICLGMQLMSRRSEEGALPGLGWLAADTVRLGSGPGMEGLRIPHMGWNTVAKTRATFFSRSLDAEARFYFVHSYHLCLDDPAHVALLTRYGRDIAAATVTGNVAGTQFHPEKSHRFGLALMRDFLEWDGRRA